MLTSINIASFAPPTHTPLHPPTAELYKNLMFLKTYDGDASDLCLTYVVADETLPGSGSNMDVELVPGGAKMEVSELCGARAGSG